MKTVILAGGRGTRLAEETHAIPKPMVLIGGRPILWHIMKHYSSYGYADFVVALGYRGYVIKEYFANHLLHECDVSVDLASGSVEYLSQSRVNWKVTLIDTGEDSMTGGRIKRLAPLLTERFLLTYGDGLSNVPLDRVVDRHEKSGALVTVTAVHPPPRFGSLGITDGLVDEFREKPGDLHDWINGGFFVVEPAVLDFIDDDNTPFESAPLTTLADRGQLAAYQHDGFWMPMDTVRERDELNRLWDSGRAPWQTT